VRVSFAVKALPTVRDSRTQLWISIILQFRASQIHEDCTIIFHNYRYHLELNHNYHQFGMHRITSAFLRAAYATIVSEVEISLR
jgi:hypothetical protein